MTATAILLYSLNISTYNIESFGMNIKIICKLSNSIKLEYKVVLIISNTDEIPLKYYYLLT